MKDQQIIQILGFITTMIPIVAVVIKLNTSITKLNTTIEFLSAQIEKSEEDRKAIHDKLNNHETRISILEGRQ